MNPGLTPKLIKILELSSDGLTARQISIELNCSFHTIDCQKTKILNELGADNITHAVAIALRRQIIK